jgi:hypothetical protein
VIPLISGHSRSERLTPAPATSFEAAGVRERTDLQRLLKEQIGCLDADANVVIVELKRDEVGAHMELQALRYAAMVSAMIVDQAVHALPVHRGRAPPDPALARADILDFRGWD